MKYCSGWNLFALFLVGVFGTNGQTYPQANLARLELRDWSIAGTNSFQSNPPTEADIRVFVHDQLHNEDNTIALCSSAFAELSETGTYSLIASFDQSGRYFCNTVTVFMKTDTGFKNQTIHGWEISDVAQIIRSIGNKQQKQLIIPQPFSQYAGSKCMATVDRIYSLNASALVDVSSNFPSFYRAKLQKLAAVSDIPADRVCKEMESDKIERMLGLSSDAGFAQAVEWSKSSDIDTRSKAVTVFGDINNTASRIELQKLTNDSYSPIADRAKQLVSKRIKQQ